MKVTIEVDCTPEEARSFLGLPDVQPMQEEMMAEIRDRMLGAVKAMDPAEMMKAWMPGSAGFDQMQSLFNLMTGAARTK
ncbi:hypothetical protein H4P12_17360 [Paracoccus sp. 11-3]|uniref:Ribosomal protein S1 n=1 Tax=Paracoccus amoyensis TaxID=2760093 RepID=A0A926GR81_9RHOB|nr:DUF6489 family protein [Paracoccus amoyensis]MBC9248435.1 hypothetical protein [Paracoccus amoyensis]